MTNQEQESTLNKRENQPDVDEVSIFSLGSLGGDARSDDKYDLRVALEKQTRLDRLLEKWSDGFSSIMVKETRQAIKSRHFVWTFFATIILTLIVTFTIMANHESSDGLGQSLLMGYLIILGFPLLIIVPISTFQSLSAEHGDGTLQLISITTMKPSEIIIGKLCNSILQIIIYMSVLAPCITFTFLLRGVDIYQIMTSLLFAFGFSLALCCLGLAMGSISSTRLISAGMQLVFAGVLLLSGWVWCFIAYWVSEEFARVSSGAHFLIAGWVCAVLSTAGLLLTAATAQITFLSDNRSTYLRLVMLVQQTLFIAFAVGVAEEVSQVQAFVILVMISLHYWLLMGGLMTITSNQLSKRVRRTMPQTIVGRAFYGLLMPGPGRGFLFAWTNGMFCCLVTMALFYVKDFDQIFAAEAFLMVAYFSLFLSSCYLLNQFLKRCSPNAPIWVGVVGMGIVMFLPTVMAAVLDAIDSRHFYFSRKFLAYANWYGAFDQFEASSALYSLRDNYFNGFEGFACVVIASVITTICAMLSASREFAAIALATPDHVLEEDREHASRNTLGQKEESIDDIFDDT